MSHTPEPWLINKVASDEVGTICREMTQEYGMLVPHLNTFGDKYKENARRIVACVNACEGLTQDHFDGGWKAKEIIAYSANLEGERDTYRDLCADLKEALHNHYWNDCTKHSKAIEALIAKAEKILNPEQTK